MYKKLLALAGSLALLAGLHAFLVNENVAELWLVHPPEVDRHLSQGELLHYAVLLVLGLPAAVLLCNAWPDSLWSRARTWFDRAGILLPALVATLLSFCISRWVTHGAWFTDDEQGYLFQIKSYRSLALTVPALQPEAVFRHPFVLVTRTVAGVQQWSGVYPPLQPALMALASFFGSPLLTQWLCAGLISFQTGRLAERLSGERALGILAAWLCATSPMLVGLSASYHTAVPGCLLSVLGVRALLAARENPSLWRGALVGACAGAAFLTRSLEGTLMVVVLGGALLFAVVRPRTHSEFGSRADPRASTLRERSAFLTGLPMLAGYALVCLIALGVYLFVNYQITGEWLKSGYTIWGSIYGRIMGFGKPMLWGRSHTPLRGVGQTIITLIRMNTWMFGWPISLLLPLAALLKPFRSQAAVYLVALSALQLFGYVFLAFGSVHDFGSAYHIWHVPWMACLMALLVRHIGSLSVPSGRFVVGLIIVGLVGFWPTQLSKWGSVADLILAPVKAVERATHGKRALVLWRSIKPRGKQSWVHWAPTSFPDDLIIWMHDSPAAAQLASSIAPDRDIYRLSWEDGQARVVLVRKH